MIYRRDVSHFHIFVRLFRFDPGKGCDSKRDLRLVQCCEQFTPTALQCLLSAISWPSHASFLQSKVNRHGVWRQEIGLLRHKSVTQGGNLALSRSFEAVCLVLGSPSTQFDKNIFWFRRHGESQLPKTRRTPNDRAALQLRLRGIALLRTR